MPSYTLELELLGNYLTDMPGFEIWADGSLDSSYSISSAGTSISITISYGGSLPSSLEFRFNDGLAEAGRTIEIQSAKINDRYVNTGNYLSSNSLTQGGSSTVDITGGDYIFDLSAEPDASEFTVGATQTFTTSYDNFNQYNDNSVHIFNMLDGADYAHTGSANDKIAGGAGNDMLRGGGGDDLIFGEADNDRLYGMDGNDRLYGGAGDDRLRGENGDDEAHGGDGSDRVYGNDGNDILTGGMGNDKVYGGNDDDILYGDEGDDTLTGGSGNDTIDGGDGADLIYAGNGNDQINGGDGNDIIVTNDGDDIASGDDGDDFLSGLRGDDTLSGGDGNDILLGGNARVITTTSHVSYGAGQDGGGTVNQDTGGFDLMGNNWEKIFVNYNITADTVLEFEFKSTIEAEVTGIGFDNDDNISDNLTFEIYGTQNWGIQAFNNYDGSGDWTHYTINVGAFYTGKYTHLIFANDDDGNQPANGVDGNSFWRNITIYESTIVADVDTIDGGADNDQIIGNKGADILTGGTGDDVISGNDGIDTIDGGANDDLIFGGDDNDILNGGAGNDEVNGNDGDDTIYSDLGNDIINGGAGTDVLNASAHTAYVTIDLSVLTAQNTRMGTDTISNIENLIGTNFNDLVLGGDANTNYIYGGGGSDRIYGNGGTDFLYGESGNDDFYISGTDAYDTLFDGGADYDELQFSADAYFNTTETFVDIERIDMNGFDAIADINTGFDFTGMVVTARGDMLGQGGNETITGSDSADYIYGLAGTDILDGGLGADFIYGGDDNDTIFGGVGNSADRLFGGNGDDTISGGDAGDLIYGEDGADTLNGDAGNDDFYVQGTEAYGDTIDGGADYDEIQQTAISYYNLATTFTNMERIDMNGFDSIAQLNDGLDFTGMTVTGRANILGQGGNETISGTDSADFIYGLAGNDTLNGGIGNDFIYGGDDVDTINGGLGIDTIRGEVGADILNGNDGNDNFYATGSDAIGDIMNGGAGSDDFYLESDITLDLTTTFTDMERVVFGATPFTITAVINTGFDLTGMTASGASRLYGDTGSETISGTESTDAIYGGLGADILIGNAGNDDFYVAGNESLGDTYNGGAGTDDEIRLTADAYFNSSNVFIDMEQLVFNGFDAYVVSGSTIDFSDMARSTTGNIIGDVGNETITGLNNADTIYGMDGDDVINGNGGDDTLYGGAGADTINGDDGNDNIYAGGNEIAGDTINGGAGNDDLYLTSNLFLDFTTSFTSMERVVFGGYTITANTGTGFDLTGMIESGSSELYGQGGNETITGTDSGDNIYGGEGSDTLNGGIGNDNFYISGTESLGDIYDGGVGTDYIRMTAASSFNSGNSFTNIQAIINGGFDLNIESGATVDFSGMNRSGAGYIVGAAGAETITGFENADLIRAGGGADIVNGGLGNDSFYISGTDARGDQYNGGAGNNYIRMEGDSNIDSTNVHTNITTWYFNGFDILVDLGSTVDFSGMNRSGTGSIVGDAGSETITGMDNTTYFYGMGGADTLIGGAGNDDFYVSGTDSLGDIIDGGGGIYDDLILQADAHFNSANSFTNLERINFAGFNLIVDSGQTVDFSGMTRYGAGQIHGSAGNETITGVETGTFIYGFAGDDTLRGGLGNDYIYGGADDDNIYGGDGRDELYGEGGADSFFMENATAFNDIERIRDFSILENDALDISDLLSGYTFGVDDLTDFVQISNSGVNSLVYVDTAGTGTFGAANQVATLYGITGLTNEVLQETLGHLITS